MHPRGLEPSFSLLPAASAPVSYNSPSLHGVPGAPEPVVPPHSRGDVLAPSPFFAAGSHAATALRTAAPTDAANMARESAPATVQARSARSVANGGEQQQQQPPDALRRDASHHSHHHSRPHTPHTHNHGGGYYTASSSEDEEEMEDAEEGLTGASAGPGRLGAGGSSGACRQSRTAERADVRHANSRWVPQRQARRAGAGVRFWREVWLWSEALAYTSCVMCGFI